MLKRPCPGCKKPRWSQAKSWEFPPLCLRCRRKNGERPTPKKPRVWISKKQASGPKPDGKKKRKKEKQ
jgi:hypothetical protein